MSLISFGAVIMDPQKRFALSNARSSRTRQGSFILGLSLALSILASCASTIVGTGAAIGIAAFEERPLATIARDTKITAQLRIALLEKSETHFTAVSIEVFEGRVLLTGIVPNEKIRADAVNLAWKTDSVKAVLNELGLGKLSLLDTTKDSWISAQLKSKMTIDKHIHAINFSIETVAGIIYLIGVAQNQAEMDKVIAHARTIRYVEKVISHVRVKQG